MSLNQEQKIREIIKDPGAHFSRPRDVAKDGSLSEAMKVEILKQWATDARAEMRATGEGMPPDDANPFQECVEALEEMGHPYTDEVEHQPKSQ